jgi:uncharacterized protein
MPEPAASQASTSKTPDYEALIRFLVKPFLEAPDALKLDCEISPAKSRVWIRLAFEGEDKGRVFGRGGRNIQAIRTVLTAIAQLAGHAIHLDVYGASSHNHEEGDSDAKRLSSEGGDRRPSRRPNGAPRSNDSRRPPRPR